MPDTPRILGPDGRPIRRADLDRELAGPTLAGVRRAWRADSVASSLTPTRLAALLRRADQGDADALLTLAWEMERRDLHYSGVLGVRKRAVCRLPISVEAASDAAADQALADEVRALLAAPGVRSARFHMLDGLGKGYSVVEMSWDTARQPWMPRDRHGPTGRRVRGYQWRDPRHFRYDRDTGTELRMIDEAAPVDGLPLAPYRFIVHEPEVLSGHPISNGLARLACVSYMCKSYTVRDWLAFAEQYGMPIRVGKWGRGATEDQIQILIDAVAGIGTDAAAAIPDSMSIEFVEAAKGGGGAPVFREFAEWSDKQVSKGVLGQTGTTDGQPGALGGQAEMGDVRADIRDSDAEQQADTLAFDLVGAYLAINHGPIDPADAPKIAIREPDQEDLKAITDACAALIPLGLRVDARRLRDRLGLPDPDPTDPEAETLGGPAPAPAAAPVADPAVAAPAATPAVGANHAPGCACCGGSAAPAALGLNRLDPTGADPSRVLAEIADDPLADWEPQLAPIVDPILAAAEAVRARGLPSEDAFAAFLDELEALTGQLDTVALIESLARATLKARGYGDATDA